MSVSVRPLVSFGVAGAVALSPVLAVAPVAAIQPRVEVPVVYAGDIQLTGLGQNIYNAIQPWVAYGVSLAAYGVGFIPFIGPPIASQININYFDGLQPFVEATVNYAAAVVQNPFNFGPATVAYGNQLIANSIRYINAQLGFIGFPPLPPFPFAATTPVVRSAAATGPADLPASLVPALKAPGQRAHESVAVVRDAVRSVIEARVQAGGEVRDAVRGARGEVRQAAKDAVEGVQKAAATDSPAEVRQAVQDGTSEVRSAVKEAKAEVRVAAKTARGEVRTAVKEARASVRAAHDGAKDAAK